MTGLARTRPARCAPVLLLAAFAGCSTAEPDVPEITLAHSGAGNPTIAVDTSTGRAYVSWIETTEGGSNVYLAAIDGTGRAEPVRVNDIDGDAAPHEQAPPQVAVGPDGAIYVVWQNNTEIPGRQYPASNLRFARSMDGGRTFEPATFVNDDADGPPASHTFQDLAVSGDGTIHVSWIDGRARAAAQATGAVTSEHAGHGGGMPTSEIRVATSRDGGRTFSAGVVVHRDACPCCRTSIAISGDSMVAVAFRSATDNIRDMMVVRSTDRATTFGDPVRVHEDGWVIDGCPHAGGSLAYDADGRLHIAWYTGAQERQGLWHAALAPGGNVFGEPAPLQADGWVPVSQVKLAAAPDGDVWIAWDDRRREQSAVRVTRAVADDVRASRVLGIGTSPAIAAGRDVFVAWQRGPAAVTRVLRAP
jgi:hypothetical protein